jgi:EAL domain-containing protein (putative c-di-GMP-specific phosphodiesterase class I)
MARALDCRSVAEGVETERQLALLVDLGVDYVQGYLTGRPLDPEAFAAHAETHWSPVTTPRRAP